MRTTSIVSCVVTRRPPRNSLSMPSRSSIAVICGPPPCTTTGRTPAVPQEDDVLGERALERRRRSSRCRRTSPRSSCRGTPSATAAASRVSGLSAPSPGRVDVGVAAVGSSGLMTSTPSSRATYACERSLVQHGGATRRRPCRSISHVDLRAAQVHADRSSPASTGSGRSTRRSSRRRVGAGRTPRPSCRSRPATRPQFGSVPKTAVLNRLLRRRPSGRPHGLVLGRRAQHGDAMSWSAPSASASSCLARSVAGPVERLGEVLLGRR